MHGGTEGGFHVIFFVPFCAFSGLIKFGARSYRDPYMRQTSFSETRNIACKSCCSNHSVKKTSGNQILNLVLKIEK